MLLLFSPSLQHTLFTAIHKHYSVEDWKNFAANHPDCLEVISPMLAFLNWLFLISNMIIITHIFSFKGLLLQGNNVFFSPQHVAASSGSGKADLEKLCAILEAIPALKYICLDVANGYSEYFVEFVKTVREKFPKHTIMVRELVHQLGRQFLWMCSETVLY